MPPDSSSNSILIEVFKLLGTGTVAVLLSGYAVTRWKYREDAVEKRIDDLCQQINNTGDLASDYWITLGSSPEIDLKGSRVQAGIVRIDGMRSTLGDFVSNSSSKEIANSESEFLRGATGGNFGVHNRDAEALRAKEVLILAAAFAVQCRRSRMKDLRGWWRRR